MSILVFRCPFTDKQVTTHIEMTPEDFGKLSRATVLLPCSCEQGNHYLNDVEAWLDITAYRHGGPMQGTGLPE